MVNPRTAIVIPARLASTRLPHKLLAPLGGVPLVVRTMRQALKTRGVDKVIVATDDARIAEAVTSHGGQVVMTRSNHPSGTDRVAEAAATLEAEWVVNVQGDEPFVDPHDVETVFAGLRERGSDMATLKAPLTAVNEWQSPNVVKVVTRNDDTALYFSRAPIPHDRSGAGALLHCFRHVGVYGYRAAALARLAQTPPHPSATATRCSTPPPV